MSAAAILVLLWVPGGPGLRAGPRGPRCNAVAFKTELKAGSSFAQSVGPLELRIRATHDKALCNGWTLRLEDAGGHDFIYPVNMPLRFNPSQVLGCSYGLTARQGLEMKRRLRFILTEKDFLRLDPLMKAALWPGDSPDPEHAAGKFLKAVRAIPTGLIEVKALQFEISPNGLVRSATFRVELAAPESFRFNPALKPYPTACPAPPAE